MADVDFVICANDGCKSRVLRRLAASSIGKGLFCGRKCLTSASKAVPFHRVIRGPRDENGGFVRNPHTVRGGKGGDLRRSLVTFHR